MRNPERQIAEQAQHVLQELGLPQDTPSDLLAQAFRSLPSEGASDQTARDFVAEVLAEAAKRPPPRPGRRLWLPRWLPWPPRRLRRTAAEASPPGVRRWRRGWQPVWAPALAVGLLLSLSLNVWLGSQVLGPQEPGVRHRGPAAVGKMPHGLAEDVARGDHYAAAGKYDDAVRAYTAVLQVAGAPVVQVLRKLAGVYYHLGQYAQAIEVATAVLVLAPDEAQAYFYRGAAQDKLGHWAQAIQDWQRAARLGDPEARAALGAWGLAW